MARLHKATVLSTCCVSGCAKNQLAVSVGSVREELTGRNSRHLLSTQFITLLFWEFSYWILGIHNLEICFCKGCILHPQNLGQFENPGKSKTKRL